VFLPLIEARKNIIEILHKANMDSNMIEHSNESHPPDYDPPVMRFLVPIDGSARSLNALYHANYLFRGAARVKIYLLHVIPWSDEKEDLVDEEMTAQIQEEGRMILRSVMVPKQINDYKRIVKLGDPAEKINELAEKLHVDMIIMGKKGLGKSSSNLGHVTQKVLGLSSKPIVLLE
jgi:nucleotide-binding universal stress UspA family protein